MDNAVLTFIFLLASFSVFSQSPFKGGKGGGSAFAQTRTQTVLALEEEDFFSGITITKEEHHFYISWQPQLDVEFVQITDVLGRNIATSSTKQKQFCRLPIYSKNALYFISIVNARGHVYVRKVI